MSKDLQQEALNYHRYPMPGKIETVATKSTSHPDDLSLAYSPGVAYPCKEIEKNQEDAYLYTNKANLVAVISNGTAVLGLGNIGAAASKPVMEARHYCLRYSPASTVMTLKLTSTTLTASSTWSRLCLRHSAA